MYTTPAKSMDTKTIRRSDDGNGASTIRSELIQPFDLSGGKAHDLLGELTGFVKRALNEADKYWPQRVEVNEYNRKEEESWGIHGFLNVQLYDGENWIPIDLRKGTPENKNPAAKKKTSEKDVLTSIDDHAIHFSNGEKISRQWEGITITVNATAAPLSEMYGKNGNPQKRSVEVAQQVTNILWKYVSC